MKEGEECKRLKQEEGNWDEFGPENSSAFEGIGKESRLSSTLKVLPEVEKLKRGAKSDFSSPPRHLTLKRRKGVGEQKVGGSIKFRFYRYTETTSRT